MDGRYSSAMPSGSQEFCLRWNNFHSSLISALDGFKNEQDFVDVTIACEGQYLKAHKMLLSACSGFLKDLLKANPCQHPIIILPPEVRFLDLERLLRFIYQGEVNVQQESLANFLKTAEMLKIRGLADDSEKQKVFAASSPRPPEGSGNSSVSPKRPRLSLDAQEPSTPNDDSSRLSGPDSDSEMIPVKQEMIELKDGDLESADSESFILDSYIKDSSSSVMCDNSQEDTPPPIPLLPSYIPPQPVKQEGHHEVKLPTVVSEGVHLSSFARHSLSGSKRKYCTRRYLDEERRSYFESWLPEYCFIQVDRKPVCLLCKRSVVSKSYNVKRHYMTNHYEFSIKYPLDSPERTEEIARLLERHDKSELPY